jgi:hypothetical protein
VPDTALFAPDRYFEVTVRTWGGTDRHVIPDTVTDAEANAANAESRATTGWPTHVTPGVVAALRATRRRRWFRRG